MFDTCRDAGGAFVDTAVSSEDTPDWGAAVLEATGGVSKVVNTIEFSAANPSLAACGYGGDVAVIGLRDQDGPSLDFSLFGESVRDIAVGSGPMYRALLNQVGSIGEKPVIDRRFAYDAVDEAAVALTKPGEFGKIVIDIA